MKWKKKVGEEEVEEEKADVDNTRTTMTDLLGERRCAEIKKTERRRKRKGRKCITSEQQFQRPATGS